MRLYFICEYRFVRCPDGRIYSPDGVFGPRLFGRYLRIFDRVTVVARVAATSVPCDPALCAELRRHELPYAVEVVGDPWDVFASGECYGGLRPLIRLRAWWQLRRTVRFASEALYVTGRTLQRRYPSSGRMFGISDVDLPPERIAAVPARYPVGRPVRLLSVGALDRMYKSPDVVLHAVALVGASGTRCSLHWIGGGQHLAAMERYAARLGIADRVRFEGQQPADRVADELRRADLFERQAARNLREASIYAAPRLQRLRDGFLQAVAMNTRH